MKKIIFLLILCLGLCGCESKNELEEILTENDYIIVDVRTKEEYEEGHLVDAINIPYDEIDEDINLDKNKTILVYCRSGNRSNIAFNILETLGFDVYDLGAFEEAEQALY